MGVFDNIGSAQYFEGGKYIAPGLYKVQILKVKNAETRLKRPFFVVEMKVLESSNVKDHPVGTDMSWMVMLDQDAALGNIKHFLSVAGDIPLGEVSKEDGEEAVSEKNPFQGIELRVMAVNIKTRAQKDFTKVKFMPGAMDAAEAQKQHAEAAAAPASA